MIRYKGLKEYMRKQFGESVYKLALDGGFTCPNRDGSKGEGGCIFCAGGSGDFAEKVCPETETPEGYEKALRDAVERAKGRVARKNRGNRFILYFQSYTGTYGSPEKLRLLYTAAVHHPEAAAVSIGTRPDCLPSEVIALLAALNREKPVWVELGLQTMHESTALYIRRGYPLSVYDDAVRRLKAAGMTVIVHQIIGLPGETKEMMAETTKYIGKSGADGIKLQLLHVLEGTELAEDYRKGSFSVMTLPEYVESLKACISVLPENVVVHRLTGDGNKALLLAPLWSADKKRVLGAIQRELLPR